MFYSTRVSESSVCSEVENILVSVHKDMAKHDVWEKKLREMKLRAKDDRAAIFEMKKVRESFIVLVIQYFSTLSELLILTERGKESSES